MRSKGLIGAGGGDDLHGVDITEQPFLQHDVDLGLTLTQGIGSRLGAAQQAFLRGIPCGSHDAAQALVDTDGGTGDDGVLDVLHLACDHGDRVVDGVFSENFRIVGAGGDGDPQNPLTDISCNHVVSPFLLGVMALSYHILVVIATNKL